MGDEPTENSRPKHDLKVLGLHYSDKMCFVPEAVLDKVQTYPTPKAMKEMQAFCSGFAVVKDSYSHAGTVSLSFMTLG